ncbi:MAG TPA: hypothetical protein VFM59_07270 [Salinimicrobium sp.]|nr:hypothetical protein [Salinimicrobium sp.]
MRGKITADSLAGTSINVINLTQETGTASSASGDFEIPVRLGDSLKFSALQFKTVKIAVSPKIIEEGFLLVELEENINELSEVFLSNVTLTGDLAKDALSVPVQLPFTMGLGLSKGPPPTSLERKLYTASQAQPVGLVNVSLDGILNSLNGKTAMLKKAIKNERLAAKVEKGIKALPQNFFIEELKLPQSEISDFVYYCAEDPLYTEIISADDPLRLIEFYYSKAPDFIENRMDY